MLKITSYSLKGQVVRVKLKCTCGNGKVFEVQEAGRKFYFCEKCRSYKTLEDLKREASTYWRGHDWVIECEADQRTAPRIHVQFAIELRIRATPFSPMYCVLHGICPVLSESGMLAQASDFEERYFQDITSSYRHVEIAVMDRGQGLPALLTGRIVGVRYRPDELPVCRIGIGFEGLTDEAVEALHAYVQTRLLDRQSVTEGSTNE
jgi:hypothetical protein